MKIEEMISAERADCCGCEACANICPKNAIKMVRDAEGFAYPTINPKRCIKCGKCDATCPSLNFTKKFPDALPKVFVAVNRNEKIRRHSSSGGVFTALSEIVLREGGIVFGAGFDKNWHVFHTAARTLDELENLRGSKYTQSQIGKVYRQVRNALKSTKVLFSGTPCQCAGLRHFLGGDNENLLTVDIICHGTPSPALWENYIGEFTHAHEVTRVNFRSKRNGWAISHVEITFADQGHYLRPLVQDFYGKVFLNALSERPSCHACKFKFPSVQSDLTLGDAWGVQNFAPEMFDNRGTSLVIIHTTKGADFCRQTNLLVREVNFADAALNNPRLITPSVADGRRAQFFNLLARNDFLAVMQHFCRQDGKDFRAKVDEQNRRALMTTYQEIAAHYRKNFTQNVLVITAPLENRFRQFIGRQFEQNLPSSIGVHFLYSDGKGRLVCTENFSSLNFVLQEEIAALDDFAKRFNIAKIFVEESTRFNSPIVVDWLRNCGLPVQTFSLPKKVSA